jgi:hypothetical protein
MFDKLFNKAPSLDFKNLDDQSFEENLNTVCSDIIEDLNALKDTSDFRIKIQDKIAKLTGIKHANVAVYFNGPDDKGFKVTRLINPKTSNQIELSS